MPPASRSVADVLAWATDVLARSGCPRPDHDAEALLDHALGTELPDPPDRPTTDLDQPTIDRLSAAVARRTKREPLEYITGICVFRGLPLNVDSRVMIPQPRFGLFVEVALSAATPRARVHDVGTGSGAIALALKAERPDLVVTASDISPDAIDVASANAARLGLDVSFTVAPNLPPGSYDLVVGNLPYQDDSSNTLALPPEELEHQPSIAIFGGADGLDVIRGFFRTVPPTVTVAIGHATAQTRAISELFVDPRTHTDDVRAVTIGLPRPGAAGAAGAARGLEAPHVIPTTPER